MKRSDKIENTYIAVLAVMIAIVVAIIGLNALGSSQNVESNITVDELATHNSNIIESSSSNMQNNVLETENNLAEGDIENNVINEVSTSTDYTESQEDVTNNQESNEQLPDDSSNEEETSVTSDQTEDEQEDNEENIENDETVNTNSEVKSEEIKPVIFVKPVEGEIIKKFAKDNLVYSETLLEWTTHYGIDIKAEKTTVVKSAADGTVKSIKNDPRYGLTVIIEHNDGYQTIYSNLLSSEFIVEGEVVTQGQSIGTVGNTATFEIADASHLHFELLQNGEYLDPTIYIK